MASNRNVIPGLDWYQAQILVLQGKTGFQVKQQFVTKTLIPRILTKHITNDSMKKKILHSNSKFSSTMYP